MILSLGRVNLFQKGDISGKSSAGFNFILKGNTLSKIILSPGKAEILAKFELGKVLWDFI